MPTLFWLLSFPNVLLRFKLRVLKLIVARVFCAMSRQNHLTKSETWTVVVSVPQYTYKYPLTTMAPLQVCIVSTQILCLTCLFYM